MEVLHEECPPRAVAILHDAALVGIGAGRGVHVDRAEAEAAAVGHDAAAPLRQRRCVVAIGLVGGDDARLVRSPDALRPRTERATVGAVVGGDEVVHAVDLVDVVSLAYAAALGNDDALGALHGAAHVGLQLRTLHLAVVVDGVDLAVIVEEHAQVVDAPLHVVVRPRAADVLRRVALQALAVDVREDVELAARIADAGCPDALAVDLATARLRRAAEREGRVGEVEAVEAVADVLPVHQVLGVQDDQAGHGVHRRACQVVVVAHAENVGVGELVVEQRVGERAVAVVGRPRLGLCLCAHGANGHQGSCNE